MTGLEFQTWLTNTTLGRLSLATLLLLLVAVASRVIRHRLLTRMKHVDRRYRVRKLVSFGSYVLAVIVLAGVFAGRLGGLTVAFGVAGAGIAFALQEVISSVAGWLAISFGGFFSIGDRVQLGGIKGDVIDIGVLRTTVMETGEWVNGDLYNGRIVRIANSFVFKEPVYNYSGDFPFLWDEIKFPVKYGSDVALARQILERVVQEVCGDIGPDVVSAWRDMVSRYRIEDARLEPMVTLVLTDNWVEFTVRYVVDYKARRKIKDRLFTRLLEEIDATDDRVGIASATLQLVPGPAARPPAGS
ncbi:MAG: mechanosensitive ion channel domain-containing protein [Candidatus Eisenbacteria bacterium]